MGAQRWTLINVHKMLSVCSLMTFTLGKQLWLSCAVCIISINKYSHRAPLLLCCNKEKIAISLITDPIPHFPMLLSSPLLLLCVGYISLTPEHVRNSLNNYGSDECATEPHTHMVSDQVPELKRVQHIITASHVLIWSQWTQWTCTVHLLPRCSEGSENRRGDRLPPL